MDLYNTVIKNGSAEQEINRSRFIAYVFPVETKEEADEYIEQVRKKHRDATHNVPAMVIGDKFQIQWGSDDGEPQGTSGAPMVQMLVEEGITNTLIVVTRYFGGIKLGTGGLVRAYTSSAKLGLRAAGVCSVRRMSVLSYEVDYASYNRISTFKFKKGMHIENEVFTDRVNFDIVTEEEDSSEGMEVISGLTNGRAVLKSEGSTLYKAPLEK